MTPNGSEYTRANYLGCATQQIPPDSSQSPKKEQWVVKIVINADYDYRHRNNMTLIVHGNRWTKTKGAFILSC